MKLSRVSGVEKSALFDSDENVIYGTQKNLLCI